MRGGYFGTRPFGVPGRRAFCSVGLAAVCAGGQRPAREPSAPRASLGASARCPASPCRPRGGLQSGGAYCLCVAGQALPPPPAPRPGPGLLYVAQLWLSIINFACNSPAACSNIEFASLELQCFWVVSKNDRGKLCAKFVWGGLDVASRSSASSCRRPPAPRPGLQVLPARFAPAVPGVLLCWLARSLPCVRYKTLPAWLLGGENGTKLSLHA